MEKEILHNKKILDEKDIWKNLYDPDFYEISERSRVASTWLSYKPVASGPYKSMPVKPLNNYIQNIGYMPTLNNISNNSVSIDFRLYADIYLDVDKNNNFYNIDRTWIRQYYNTRYRMTQSDKAFNETYKFFVPWFIDCSSLVNYYNIDDSAFIIEEKEDYWYAPESGQDRVFPHFVTFMFKNSGYHMRENDMGVIRRGDPMFTMTARIDDIIVLKQIEEQYANN